MFFFLQNEKQKLYIVVTVPKCRKPVLVSFQRLQQELTELAINLNMEAQKGRKQRFDFNR
jgi:hypothetical protein